LHVQDVPVFSKNSFNRENKESVQNAYDFIKRFSIGVILASEDDRGAGNFELHFYGHIWP